MSLTGKDPVTTTPGNSLIPEGNKAACKLIFIYFTAAIARILGLKGMFAASFQSLPLVRLQGQI